MKNQKQNNITVSHGYILRKMNEEEDEMIEIKNKKLCSGCTACASVCPVNCITMESDDEGFLYPVVDKSRCVNCGLCEKICPILNKKEDKKIPPKAYAVINNDLKVRMNSSSGGAFSLLADYVLDNGGVVFGASFDEKFNVCHRYIERKEDLQKLRASKYVQSNLAEGGVSIFKKAKEFLDGGRMVLFTGTACQIGGLKSYLRKDYDNLITQDLICHGVPSPLVWKKYVEYRSKKAKANLQEVSFRDKRLGWLLFSMRMKFTNNKVYQKNHLIDPMFVMFLFNKCLRPCCYACSFKTITRQSDVTLADFWGVNSVCKKLNDGKGISLVLIQTKKGAEIFDKIKAKITYLEVPFEKAVAHNKMYTSSVKEKRIRTKFFKDLNSLPFEKIIRKYGWLI